MGGVNRKEPLALFLYLPYKKKSFQCYACRVYVFSLNIVLLIFNSHFEHTVYSEYDYKPSYII